MTMHLTNLPRRKGDSTAVFPANASTTGGSTFYRSIGKRVLETTLVILSSPITLTIAAVLVVLLLLTGQKPFYTQSRIGLNGRVFRMWKLRTMLPDADERLEQYLQSNPSARAEWDSKQKLIDDPRITALGKILRKTSLDEVPQLFNVVNGTMSLVGPRPMMVCQQEQYSGSAYYSMRPGVSGLWQISDRNEGDFAGRVGFDEAYRRKMSLSTDLYVMMRTIVVMLRGTGH